MTDRACGCDVQRYCLISDGDSRDYLCPVERRQEGQDALYAVIDYWEHFDSEIDGPEPLVPDYLIYVDNPYNLMFENPQEMR